LRTYTFAFHGSYKLILNKISTFKFEFIKNWNNSYESPPIRYYFLGNKVTKLNLIKVIIKLGLYRSEIENFDLKIMPGLEVISQKDYKFKWTNRCLQA
jgi:hypothetical protein